MAQNLYALLVGIDNYVSPGKPLKGCVNDILAFKDYLKGRIAKDGYQLHLCTLLNEQATRQAVIDNFRQHLCQAGNEDVALFYYAGHGGQQDSPEAFWKFEPDRLDETLVCFDSLNEDGWGLADKELAKLIAEVDQKKPHITAILDCCHSGSGTRGDLWDDTVVRNAPCDRRKRPLDSYIFSLTDIEHLSGSTAHPDSNSSGWTLPKGQHIVLSACRDSELAKEYNGDQKSRGAFSYFLLDTLHKANGSLTYRDLFKRTNALVRSKLTNQSPQIEATHPKDLDQPFLGGAIAPSTPYFTVSHNKDHGWAIDGGAVHGISQPAGGQTTLLALFPLDCSPEQLRQLSEKIGTGEVIKILPHLSTIQINGVEDLNPETTYKAVITSLPLPPKGILMAGDLDGIQFARAALQKFGSAQQPSLYVKEVVTAETAEFKLLAREGQYVISRPTDDRPLVAEIQGYSATIAMKAIQQLEHMARWTNIAELSSPATSRIQPGAVQMSLSQDGKELQESQIRLEYQLENGKWKRPSFKVKLRNTSSEPLYCALLDLTDRYSVSTKGLLPGGGIWLDKGEESWAYEGKPIPASVQQELWECGITETKDLLKLMVSTAEFDATLLEQENLGLPASREVRMPHRGQGTLNRLMRRVQTRDLGAVPDEEELYDDWVSSQVSITTVRPLDATPVPNEGSSASLGVGVSIQPHPGLKAQVRLTTVTQSTRDLGSLVLPPILREDDTVAQPFQFTTSRGTDPGLSALELNHVDADTIATVTPQHPLKLSVDTLLGEGERVLAIAHDGEFFLPLGFGQTTAGKTEISLERLPNPVSTGERSLTGAIRIFFQKVVSEKLKLEFDYPILAAVNVVSDGTVSYERDAAQVKDRVAKAKRIVLYIHGIIGDTESMVPSIRTAKMTVNGQEESLGDQYDLVLAFDYESLNTSIENHARELKQRLAAVGLDVKHGKELHIVAHSMGGLVSRWFIEREGGNKIVSHLIMLGTPNGGSPWPTVQAWGTAALAIGLNSLSTVAWPVKVLGSLVAAIETIDITLDQMQPGSEFLKSLAASPDPQIPYTILAGNTSITPAAVDSNLLQRLMQKVMSSAVALPFFGQVNDIAATVYSITQVPEGRSPQPQVQEVGCDHLVYFTNSEGLQALSKVISNTGMLA
ncbi:caspase family protein [Acaryochloris marina]|uniref:caspase family protein n=1 Tax=Acaryochloris marina TaxID=155978 RepID=UPI001BB07357|nr:caspase family protein [Acaryochloris marina]QUY45851.1 caspase family protein [Acaryochloris marina S15]